MIYGLWTIGRPPVFRSGQNSKIAQPEGRKRRAMGSHQL